MAFGVLTLKFLFLLILFFILSFYGITRSSDKDRARVLNSRNVNI